MSRFVDKQVSAGKKILSDEFDRQVDNNLNAVIDVRKKFGDAFADVAVDTMKNSVEIWKKEQGTKLANEALNELRRLSETKIKNALAKKVAIKALDNADYLIDVGIKLKKLMNGEITKAEFLRSVGENGTAFVTSSVFTAIGTMTLGPVIGATLGSMVGYFATNCLYGAVLQAFEDAELSRKRYEAIHKFCEYQIREMRIQRAEFERQVATFLKDRQEIIDRSLNDFEVSMKMNDFDGISSALSELAEDFGGELQFKTFDEFDEFMSDDDTVLKL